MAGCCVLALGVTAAEARGPAKCASDAELTAMQATAVQQELMDAALTCGESAQTNYNAFQTSFGPELRRSDNTLLRMFRRVIGSSKGDAAYNQFKTDLASKAELHRIHGNADFCTAAGLVSAAALGPQKPRPQRLRCRCSHHGGHEGAHRQLPNPGCRNAARRPGGAKCGANAQSVAIAALTPKPEILAPVEVPVAPQAAPPAPQPPAKQDDGNKSSGSWLSGLLH